MIIETHNHGYTRYDAAAFPGQRIANTNFSRSGGENDGSGYLRFDRESELLKDRGARVPRRGNRVSAAVAGSGSPAGRSTRPATPGSHCRPTGPTGFTPTTRSTGRCTASAVVIQGVPPGQDPVHTTMWVALGEPVTTIAVPLWFAAGVPPDELWQGKDAPITTEAFRLKALLRPLKARERAEYLDLTRLDNASGTGWLPGLLAVERDIVLETEAFLRKKPAPAELAAFQKSMAARAHAALKAINPPPRSAPAARPAGSALAAPALAEGVVLQQRREQDKAVAAFDRAIAADPASADAYLLKCRSLAGLRRHEEAVAACTESLRLRPDQAEVLRDRGHYQLNLGHIEPGLADLQKAESLTSRDRGVYYHLGLAYYLNGDFTRAAKAYEACASNSADAAGKVECQAWLLPSLMRSGRKDEAKKLLAAVPAAPIGGHPGNYLDRLLLFKGEKTEAQVAATMAAEGQVSEATVGYSIGIWHLLNGHEAKAREYFQRSVASNYTPAWGYRASEAELKRLGRRPGATS